MILEIDQYNSVILIENILKKGKYQTYEYSVKKYFAIFLEFSGLFNSSKHYGIEFHIIDPASPKVRASWTGEISDDEADCILQVWHWRRARLCWTISTHSDRYAGELWWIAEWMKMHILELIRSLTDNHFIFLWVVWY